MTNTSGTRTRSPAAGFLRSPLLLAGVSLLGGLDAALILLGVPAPVLTVRLPEVHGAVMVLGFVGTLVCLERSVALGRPAAFAAPALLGLGSVALLLSPIPPTVGRVGLTLGMAGMCLVYLPLWRRQRDDAVLVQALGAVLGLGAAAMWLGGVDIPRLLPWLGGFLILTIAGERLELARVAMGPQAGTTLVLLSTGLIAGAVAALLWPGVGTPLLGIALLALVAWLVRHDIAWRTIRTTGVTRFMAAGMLPGYAWLLVTAVIWIVRGPSLTDGAYDAVVHAMFLGFTISMVMAHAPVILPAVVRRQFPYHWVLWIPLVGLHVGLIVRLWAGDLKGNELGRQIGGVANVVALLMFFAMVAVSILAHRRTRPARTTVGRTA